MTRQRVPLIVLVLILGVSGCDPAPGDGAHTPSAQPPDPPTATAPEAPPASTGTSLPPAPTGPPGDGRPDPDANRDVTSFRTAYGWAVPAPDPVTVSHRVRPPVARPPAPPLPYLAEIRAADHPEGRPGYSRISFYFRNGFPSYELGYVPAVRAEGTGEPIKLPGNAFLRIRFVQAQAHDERGRSSVTASPRPALGFPTLRGYGFGGDYEGYLTYGLGLAVAAGSDQVLPIRALELTRSDGSYVIAVDVQRS